MKFKYFGKHDRYDRMFTISVKNEQEYDAVKYALGQLDAMDYKVEDTPELDDNSYWVFAISGDVIYNIEDAKEVYKEIKSDVKYYNENGIDEPQQEEETTTKEKNNFSIRLLSLTDDSKYVRYKTVGKAVVTNIIKNIMDVGNWYRIRVFGYSKLHVKCAGDIIIENVDGFCFRVQTKMQSADCSMCEIGKTVNEAIESIMEKCG